MAIPSCQWHDEQYPLPFRPFPGPVVVRGLIAGHLVRSLRSSVVNLEAIAREKERVRERVWAELEQAGASRFPGARGRIPNFVGTEAASDVLAGLPEWRNARVVKANPDSPQLPVRARALSDGKTLYMAVPRLREARPFLRLDPGSLRVPPRKAASIRGAAAQGQAVAVDDLEHVDLVVCGSVAVNRRGVRVGKGGGYSDLEFALLMEAGRIDDRTTIVTTVHLLQMLEDDLPETEHDFRVDRIVTAEGVIRCRRRRRPPGILWDHLSEEKVQGIPVLASLRRP
jgi:5-formyltetrahydrofolate cyclo-ligase